MSAPTVRYATLGIAVGLAIMLLSVCIVKGYQHAITTKVTDFASHITILDARAVGSPESHPVVTDAQLIAKVKRAPGVRNVERFSLKIGLLKTETDFAGFMLKGVAQDYDLWAFSKYVVQGKLPEFTDKKSSNSIVISRTMADKLGLKVGDKVYSYYFAETIKQRRFKVAAIYETYLRQFDQTYVLTDLYTVNQLNSWSPRQSSGLEVRLDGFGSLDAASQVLSAQLAGKSDGMGGAYSVERVDRSQRTGGILAWLSLLDVNVKVILGIMVCVSGFTMISGLLVLILERTRTIGLLKALGASNTRIRHVFLWLAALIIGRGMLIGNVLALALAFAQRQWHIVPLDASQYYLPAVPVEFDVPWIIGINVASLLVTVLALIVPSFLVSRIQPATAIRFD